jgi:hypothetical protein
MGTTVTVRGVIAILVWGCVLSAWGQGVKIRFNQAEYTARPSESVSLGVELESALSEGLFSYGVLLVYDPVMGGVVDAASILVPPALNFDGVRGPGAFKQIGSGTAGVKGTVDFFAQSAEYYTGTALATFTVTPETPGEYQLMLKLFNTLGPTESIFVAGDGSKLDDQIGFSEARLVVIPEPGCWALLVLGGTLMLSRRYIHRPFDARREAHG